MRGRVLVALLGLVALPARAEERAEADLRRLFPQQAAVFVVPPGGLARLKVPAEVLAAVGPDLSDLRLFDRRGREVPYVIDTGPEARARVEVKETAEAAILDVQRQEIRRDDGPPRRFSARRLFSGATSSAARGHGSARTSTPAARRSARTLPRSPRSSSSSSGSTSRSPTGSRPAGRSA